LRVTADQAGGAARRHCVLFGQVVVIYEASCQQIGRRTRQQVSDTRQPLDAERLNDGWLVRLQLNQQLG
jgi:hypothetical protein